MDLRERREMENLLAFSDSKLDFDCWLDGFEPLHEFVPCWTCCDGKYSLKLYVGFFEEDQIKLNAVGYKLELNCKSGVVPGKPEWSNRELKRIYKLPVDADHYTLSSHYSQGILVVKMLPKENQESFDSWDIEEGSSHKTDTQEGSSSKTDTEGASSSKRDTEGDSSSKRDAEEGSSSKRDEEGGSSYKKDKPESSSSKKDKPESSSSKKDKSGSSSSKSDKSGSSSSKKDKLEMSSAMRKALYSYKITTEKSSSSKKDEPGNSSHKRDTGKGQIDKETQIKRDTEKGSSRTMFEQEDKFKKLDLHRILKEEDRLQYSTAAAIYYFRKMVLLGEFLNDFNYFDQFYF